MKKKLFAVLLLVLFSVTTTFAPPSAISWFATKMTKHEERNPYWGYTVVDTTKMVLNGDKLQVERILYYPVGSQYLFWINIENFDRVVELGDWFICTNAYDVPVIGVGRGGRIIANTNVAVNYLNERSYPGGNGTVVFMSGEDRFTTISTTTWKIDNSNDEYSYTLLFMFWVGGTTYVTDRVGVGPGQVVFYTPSLATLSRLARRRVNTASLVSIRYGSMKSYDGHITNR